MSGNSKEQSERLERANNMGSQDGSRSDVKKVPNGHTLNTPQEDAEDRAYRTAHEAAASERKKR